MWLEYFVVLDLIALNQSWIIIQRFIFLSYLAESFDSDNFLNVLDRLVLISATNRINNVEFSSITFIVNFAGFFLIVKHWFPIVRLGLRARQGVSGNQSLRLLVVFHLIYLISNIWNIICWQRERSSCFMSINVAQIWHMQIRTLWIPGIRIMTSILGSGKIELTFAIIVAKLPLLIVCRLWSHWLIIITRLSLVLLAWFDVFVVREAFRKGFSQSF